MSEVLAERVEELPDEELLTAARAGNRAAFTQLYQRHHADAVRYARRFVRTTADAEDVAANALLRLMLALEAGRGPLTNVPAYLRTTVRRLAIDLATRNARSLAIGLDCTPADGRRHLDEKERDAILELAFTGLPPRWREVLWLVEVVGYRPQDIAAELRIARPAACSLLWRARTALRKRYDELSACVPTEG
ncbi:RNA polymerase sigma factor [Amycolatopsis sacchari]|uniref:RNA polymerase sigma factor, sigma-70 family n=1 Tax=Amycolatopsis sacchari TaxID=115433 RepID=A0A1I3Q0M7_9PSEU|nr:sigma-70 family RNA polymerase sigma factor [Amycolatopsis sacchari]SFJ26706.1 RNA polymerase sigma factor, sigma-70 family [Amycolatopsis sacchari]